MDIAETDTDGTRHGIVREPVAAGAPAPEPLKPDLRVFEQPAGRNGAAGWALGVAVLALIAVLGVGGALWVLYIQPLAARVAALESRPAPVEAGADLAGRVDRLEAARAELSGAEAGGQAGDAPPLDADRLAALERDMAQLKAEADQVAKRFADMQLAAGGRELLAQSIRDIQSSTAATQGEVERLSTRLATVGGRLDQIDAALADTRQQGLKAEAILLAVNQLRAGLRDGKPFARELAALSALAGADSELTPVLDQLEPFADSGVPTLDQLRTGFSRLAPQIVHAAAVGDGSSWIDQALYHVESVVSIRRVGAATPGDTADAVVARAQGKLEDDDLKGAVAILRSFAGPQAVSDLLSPWIRDAEQRIAADAADADLTRLAIDRIGAGNPVQGGPAQGGPPQSAPPSGRDGQ